MIQGFEGCFVALLRLLNRLSFGDAFLRVGQVAFFRPLLVQMRLRTLFVVQICRGSRGIALDRFQVVRIPKTVACGGILSDQNTRLSSAQITFVTGVQCSADRSEEHTSELQSPMYL